MGPPDPVRGQGGGKSAHLGNPYVQLVHLKQQNQKPKFFCGLYFASKPVKWDMKYGEKAMKYGK